jgi:hypothetical protein
MGPRPARSRSSRNPGRPPGGPPGSRLLACGVVLAVAFTIGAVALAGAAMRSTKLAPGLCETTGGGRIVPIPGFPGERIDRRLLTDIRWLEELYPIYITDGYSLDGVHAANGEHPLGLALDIVPNAAEGGRWSDIDRLARWAEPRQDHPRQPFRWVGYNGDAGHGRDNHLHLSWSHSVATKGPGQLVRTVFTIRCPQAVTGGPTPSSPTAPPPSEPPATEPVETNPPVGGVKVGGRGGDKDGNGGDKDGPGGDKDGPHSGGIDARPRMAPPVVETGGIGLGD